MNIFHSLSDGSSPVLPSSCCRFQEVQRQTERWDPSSRYICYTPTTWPPFPPVGAASDNWKRRDKHQNCPFTAWIDPLTADRQHSCIFQHTTASPRPFHRHWGCGRGRSGYFLDFNLQSNAQGHLRKNHTVKVHPYRCKFQTKGNLQNLTVPFGGRTELQRGQVF